MDGSTLTATGFSGAPNGASSTETALTLKPIQGPPANPLGENGLGENAGTGTGCTDTFAATDCESANPTSVALVTSSNKDPITDVVIGSVQAGESFQLYTSTDMNLADLAPFGSVIVGGTSACVPFMSAAATCQITFPATDDFLAVGLQDVSGDVLLSAVSENAPMMPDEPAPLWLLGIALVGIGVFRLRNKRTSI